MKCIAKLTFAVALCLFLEAGAMAQGWLTPAPEELNPPFCIFLFGHCSPGTTSGGLFYFSTGTYYYTPNLYFFTPGVYFFTPGTYYVFPDPLLKQDVDGVIQNLLHRRTGSRTDPVGSKLYQAHCPGGNAIQGNSLEGSSRPTSGTTAGGPTTLGGRASTDLAVIFDHSSIGAFAFPGTGQQNTAWSLTIVPPSNAPFSILGSELIAPIAAQGLGNFTLSGPVTSGSSTIGVTITGVFDNQTFVSFVASSGSSTLSCDLTPTSGLGPFTAPLFSQTDPVSTADGEFVVPPVTDLSLGGPLPLFLRRTYTSLQVENSYVGILGFNWMTNFDPYIITDSNVVAVFVEGGRVVFQHINGTYQMVFPAALSYQLVETENGGYRFLDPRQNLIYTFNSAGRLIQIQDRNGNALTVVQGPSGPTQVSDGLGRTLNFSYSSLGRVTTLTDQTGRSITYGRNGNLLASVTDADRNSTAYAYDPNFGITATRRPRGNVPYTQAYNEFGQVIEQTDSEENKSSMSYASGGTTGVNALTDPLGRTTTFGYPNLLDPANFTDAAGETASATYDSAHRQLTLSDRLGNISSAEYDPAMGDPLSFTDAQGNTTSFTWQAHTQGEFTFYNLAKITYPDGNTKSFTYDPTGNPLTVTNRAGKTTTYTYNSAGQEVTETNPAGGVTTFTYNTDGTLATLKEPSGNVTTYSYDNLKRLAKVRFADNTTRSITRDATDKILSVTDERNNTTSLAYDANSNIESKADPLAKSATVSYNSDDLPSSSTDRLGDQTSYQYDPLGSVTAITDAAGEKSTYTYDNLERLQSAVDPAGKATTFAYDAEGRLTSVTDAVGNTSNVKLDKDGRQVQFISPLNENTNVAYDSVGRVTGSTDALGRPSSFTYEPRGLLMGIASPGGIATSIAWGNLPVPASVTDPNGNVWPLTTDNQGRVTSSTDPLGQSLKYTYDSRNRIQSITSPIDSVQFSRDADGNLTQTQYSDGVTQSYGYDNDNRLVSGTGFSFTLDADGRLTGSNGLTIARDAVGRIASITYASGKTVTYTYDGRGLLAMIADWAGGSAKFTFDDAHRLVSISRSNGVATQYTYDKDGRVASSIETSSGNSLASITLARDAIGRVTAANRVLPQEAAPVAGYLPLAFDAANQISGFTYDARGRLVQGDAGSTYQWSAASRLLSYSRSDGSASATYDALGQRISRTAGGTTRNYVINYATGIPTVATVQSGGSDLTYYVYAPGGSLLFSIDAASGSHRFYSFDETGSTTLLTGDNGAVTDSYGISPYGDIVTAGPDNTTDNPFTWQGQLGVMREPGTMLYYARFRYYDAATARFLSRDPLFSPEPREVNPYQYAAGDPLSNGDPLGLKKANLSSIFTSSPGTINSLLPLPFCATQTSGNVTAVSICQTDLLYPFVTNQAGFDTVSR